MILGNFLSTIEKLINQTNYFSEVHLLVKGTGDKKILSDFFSIEPSEVKIYGEPKNCKKACNFQRSSNNVVLYFNFLIETCEKMFYKLTDIEEIDLSNFDFSRITSINNMFHNCTNLKKVEFGNINTSSLTYMEYLFAGCTNLESIDLSKFDTSRITSFYCIFNECININKINLGNIDTSLVTNFGGLFRHCEKIEFIDISNFNTSSSTDMYHLFFHCYALKVIAFPENFDITRVTYMNGMFSHCKSLVALNLSNFNLSKDAYIGYMFNTCIRLKYIDFSNFHPISINKMQVMFQDLSSLVYLNIPSLEKYSYSNMNSTFNNSNNNRLKVCAKQTNMKDYLSSKSITNNCEHTCFKQNIKIKYDKNDCITSCKEIGYTHEYLNICYNQCPEYTHAIKTENDNDVLICLDKKPKGYYLDTDGFYKECYESCKLCDGKGDEIAHNCTTCKPDYYFFDDSYYKNNCYKKCPSYYYYDDNYRYHCADNCSVIYYNLIINSNKCIDNCEKESIYKYEYDKICYEECHNGINSEKEGICLDSNIYQYINTTNNEIIGDNEEIFQRIKEKSLYNYNISNREEMIIKGKDNYYFQITNINNDIASLNEEKNKTNKFSVLDLGKCETELKNYYHININDSLLIIKYEKISNISLERSFQYEIYEPYNLTKLDLSICFNTTIDVYTPVILSQKLQNLREELKDMGYNLFDINSPFYQDICTSYTSSDGTDVPLAERINYYYNNNETVCQANCKFSDYLMNSQYLKCDCDTTISEINIKNAEKFNPKLIYESFYSVLKFSNYKVLICYKLVFEISRIIKNIGSIMTLIFFILFIIFFILYILKGRKQLNIYLNKANKFIAKDDTKKEQLENDINQTINKKDTSKSKIKKFNKDINNDSKLKINKEDNEIKKKQNKKYKTRRKSQKIKDKIISKSDNKIFFDYYELNNFDYSKAKELDKRNILEIYSSFLKREHSIIFTFVTKDDYNITMIKYSRFVFLFCTNMAMNVFFFSDETMHKLFLDYGKYNFIQQIPQIVYSTMVSKLIETISCFLSMTDKYYYQIKENKHSNKKSISKIKKYIKKKIIFFFLFTLLMFLFYWYLITCFCTVYQNTQITFIKDSLLSFLLDNLIPFAIYIFPALFRSASLKTNGLFSKFMYQLSNIIPLF